MIYVKVQVVVQPHHAINIQISEDIETLLIGDGWLLSRDFKSRYRIVSDGNTVIREIIEEFPEYSRR